MFLGILFAMACNETREEVTAPTRFLAHAQSTGGCNTSCETEDSPLSEEQWLLAFDSWREQPLGEATIELETLLFYAKESQNWLVVYGKDLRVEQRDYLERELARDKIEIEMRLVDEYGVVRGRLESSSFALKEKQHLPFATTGSLGYLETSGKVKRVGLTHLWSRW